MKVQWLDVLRHFGFDTMSSLYLAVLAGAYEYYDTSLVTDATYDTLCKYTPMPSDIGFDNSTGMWVAQAIEKAAPLKELIADCVATFEATKHRDFQYTEALPHIKRIYTNHLRSK